MFSMLGRRTVLRQSFKDRPPDILKRKLPHSANPHTTQRAPLTDLFTTTHESKRDTTASTNNNNNNSEKNLKKNNNTVASSSSSSVAASTVDPSTASLQEQLHQQHKTLRQLSEQLFTLTQHHGALQRRLALLEDLVDKELGVKLKELYRTVGALELRESNTSELLLQLENKVLWGQSNPPANREAHKNEGSTEEMSPQQRHSILQECQQMMEQQLAAPPTSTTAPAPDWKKELEQLREEMTALLATVRQPLPLLEHFTTTRVAEKVTEWAEVASSSSEAVGTVVPLPRLAALLRHSQCMPFQDADGTTRVASQKISVRGVPPGWGAAAVRQLCERVGGEVVSCLVSRVPSATPTTAFASQRAMAGGGTTTTAPPSPSSTRSFEVTFRDSQSAVKAITELHQHEVQLRPRLPPKESHNNNNNNNNKDRSDESYAARQPRYRLVVEPIVSADIIAALDQLEQEKEKKKREK